jgi:hypothetical protein
VNAATNLRTVCKFEHLPQLPDCSLPLGSANYVLVCEAVRQPALRSHFSIAGEHAHRPVTRFGSIILPGTSLPFLHVHRSVNFSFLRFPVLHSYYTEHKDHCDVTDGYCESAHVLQIPQSWSVRPLSSHSSPLPVSICNSGTSTNCCGKKIIYAVFVQRLHMQIGVHTLTLDTTYSICLYAIPGSCSYSMLTEREKIKLGGGGVVRGTTVLEGGNFFKLFY